MALLHTVLIALHVITAAAWFGMALRLVSQARLVSQLGPGPGDIVAADGARAVRLMGIFVVLTFAFSMGALALGGGYAGQPQYHIASLLIVLWGLLQYLLIAPAWKAVSGVVAQEEPSDISVRHLAKWVGIGHLIWFTLVVLMFWNRLAPSL